MKFNTRFTALLALGSLLFTQLAGAAKVGDDLLIVNKPGSSANKAVQFGSTSQGSVRFNTTTNQMEYANDGSTFQAIGSGSGGGGVGSNYLKDSNGQAFPTGSIWTVASGTGSADGVNFTDGLQSIKVTASSQQSKLSQDVTPTTQISAQNMQATMWVKTSLTNVQVCARVGGVAANCQPVSSANTWAPYTATFVGPASGSIGIEVSMTSSASGSFNAQLGYVGKAVQTAMLSQAQLIGSIKYMGASGCEWDLASGGFSPLSANTNCNTPTVTGTASAPATKVPAIVFPSLPPGEYVFVAHGSFYCSGGVNICEWRFEDGTNNFGYLDATGPQYNSTITGRVSYTTAQSNLSVQITTRVSSNGSQINVATAAQEFEILVFKYPSQQQQGYRPDATPASWSGYQKVTGGWSFSNTGTPAAPTAGSGITITQLTARNMTCSNFGTAAGITCNLPSAGLYEVCLNEYNNPGTSLNWFPSLRDGSGTLISMGPTSNNNNAAFSSSWCGQYNAAQTGNASFQIYSYVNSSSSQIINSDTNNPAISWQIKQLDAPLATPYLVGAISSSTTSQEHIERATILNNGTTASVGSQSGSWITGASRIGAGQVNLTFAAGEFSATPACVCNAKPSGVEEVCWTNVAGGTPSATLGVFQTADVGGGTRDVAFDVICMGPR